MEEEYTLTSSVPHRPPFARPLIVVQARMGSTRLPGKVMMPMSGIPMLQGMVGRLHSQLPHAEIIIATTANQRDQPIVEMARQLGVAVFRGSEEDVLDRFAKAVAQTPADAIVRLTGDCPLMVPSIVDKAIDLFYHVHPDYLSNTLRRTYPRGLDIEIFSRKTLERAANEAVLPKDREHVTTYIVSHPELFVLANFTHEEDLSSWRLTVDTKDDFVLVERVMANLGSSFSYVALKEFLHGHPEWQKMNAHVQQKRE